MKILIADTMKDTKGVLGNMLVNEGYECIFVENENEVIDKVYSELPDIIILGMEFPKLGGKEILKKLKSAPSTRDIPVILTVSKKSQRKLAEYYQLGAYDYISMPYFREEVLARIRNVTYACERVKELSNLLDRDHLTGLYNRRFFMERFEEELAWSKRYKEPFSLMILDIDHFKKINDTYGHSCGDEILKQLANTLLSVFRREDIVARYGGEEFIALLPNTPTDIDSTLINSTLTIAERVRIAVKNREFSCNNITLSLSISIGVTSYTMNVEVVPENIIDILIGQADSALYAAKAGGRDRVVVYND